MCFSSSDKTNDPPPKPAQIPHQQTTSSPPLKSKASMPQDHAPPSGPPPTQRQQQQQEYAPPSGPPPSHSQQQEYAPPSGPPPSQSRANDGYAPPSGPPPSKGSAANDYAPPAGPPPPKAGYGGDYAPPAGPPPTFKEDGKKLQDWEAAVPDTSLLPPPPNFFSGMERSATNNATEEQAEEGERWCKANPMFQPMQADPRVVGALEYYNIGMHALTTPPGYPPYWVGNLERLGPATWKVRSPQGQADTTFLSYPPLYLPSKDSPLATGRTKRIYYEVRISSDHSTRDEVSLALGFSAPPYPQFRLPGWHRGSVGIHGDDGSKFINDRWGGKTFTAPLKKGETVGVGMDLIPGQGGGIAVEVFFTRNWLQRSKGEMVEVGRWNLHEESDAVEDLPVTGLEGFHDLCASVGCFEKVGFEIVFDPADFAWSGYQG